jgi:hypothetical protein
MVCDLMCQLLLWKCPLVDNQGKHFRGTNPVRELNWELVNDCRGGCDHSGGTEG